MISSIKVHQPPSTPNPALRGAVNLPNLRRLDHLQYLDLTDCTSLGDAGLKMVVETCPQLFYLFLRRCTNISGTGTLLDFLKTFPFEISSEVLKMMMGFRTLHNIHHSILISRVIKCIEMIKAELFILKLLPLHQKSPAIKPIVVGV